MVQINFASREVNCKIVYYGPGRCGKTTNLQLVHEKAPANSTGELVSIATETDRTLYFDFLPLDLGTVAGMRTKFQLYTVPGQVYYDATRKLVLQGCDGVVFVADSNPDLMADIESLDNLAKNLKENGLDLMDIPVVLQCNKRDLPNTMSIEEMNAKLNRNNWPLVEAVAVNGDGVFQTLKAISQGVIKRLNREQGFTDDGQKRGGRTSALGGAVAKTQSPTPGKNVSNVPNVPPVQPPVQRQAQAPVPPKPVQAPVPPKPAAPLPPKSAAPQMQQMPRAPQAAPSPGRPGPQPGTASRPFDAPSAGGAPMPQAPSNPFRERLADIKTNTPNQQASEQNIQTDQAPAKKKGCLFRSAAVAVLLVSIVVSMFYFLK